MRISCFALCGIRALAELVKLKDGDSLSTDKIATNLGVSRAFLGKSVTALEKAKLVKTSKGAGGGACLAKPPTKITLLDALEAMDGKITGSASVSTDPGRIQDQCDEVVLKACDDVATKRRKLLRGITLADLVA